MKSFLLVLFLVGLASLNLQAQEKSADEDYSVKVQPLLKQCDELKTGDNPELEAALKALPTGGAAEKIRSADLLAKACYKKSVNPLVLLLADPQYQVRIAAVQALGQLGDPESVDALLDLKTDPEWKVRFVLGPVLCAFPQQRAGYGALNFISMPRESPPLDEGEIRVRCQTILAIDQMRDVGFSRKALRFMFAYLVNENEVVRNLAKATMHELRQTRNFNYELIGELKQTHNPRDRKTCAYWLGELKIERGRDALKEAAANDADAEVKKAATEALQKLGPEESENTPPKTASKPPVQKIPVKKTKS